MAKEKYPVYIYCPICEKRTIDMLTPSVATVRFKCNHCDKTILLELSENAPPKVTRYYPQKINKTE